MIETRNLSQRRADSESVVVVEGLTTSLQQKVAEFIVFDGNRQLLQLQNIKPFVVVFYGFLGPWFVVITAVYHQYAAVSVTCVGERKTYVTEIAAVNQGGTVTTTQYHL